MERSFRPTLASLVGDSGAHGQVVSFALHVAVMFVLRGAMLALGEDDREEIERDHIQTMRAYLDEGAEKEQAREVPTPQLTSGKPGVGDPTKPSGRDGWGNKGDMGRRDATTHGHWSAKGSASKANATLARTHELEEASTFGVIGILSAELTDKNAPTAPWGSVLDGADEESHIGNNWAASVGDAFGTGLGLSGGGEGGGGLGEGVALGRIGSIGCGGCLGQGHGRLGGSHVTRAPVLRCGGSVQEEGDIKISRCAASVNGRLPPEVVQRVVRQNFGRFRSCYESGLHTSPSLSGRVTVKFVIDRAGAVAVAQDGGSDLADSATVACVVRAFGSLSFPQPEGGIVTVVYPLVFSPE